MRRVRVHAGQTKMPTNPHTHNILPIMGEVHHAHSAQRFVDGQPHTHIGHVGVQDILAVLAGAHRIINQVDVQVLFNGARPCRGVRAGGPAARTPKGPGR